MTDTSWSKQATGNPESSTVNNPRRPTGEDLNAQRNFGVVAQSVLEKRRLEDVWREAGESRAAVLASHPGGPSNHQPKRSR